MLRRRGVVSFSLFFSSLFAMPALSLLSGCSRSDTATASAILASDVTSDADADRGRQLFMSTCASCHGAAAQGLPHQGVNLRMSKFVAAKDDDQLVNFIRNGRKPEDPSTVEGLPMPARGGNPQLDDESLRDIVSYLRVIQKGFTHGTATAAP
jgi:mono/diheme cytochrome c family protein